MLWRESYSTKVLEDPELPPLEGANLHGEAWNPVSRIALAASFSVREMQQREVWLRLFAAELGIPFAIGVVLPVWTRDLMDQLRGATPKSRWTAVFAFTDPAKQWEILVHPDDPGRVFALLIEDQRAEFLMIGPPTEEAWERFLLASRQPPRSSR